MTIEVKFIKIYLITYVQEEEEDSHVMAVDQDMYDEESQGVIIEDDSVFSLAYARSLAPRRTARVAVTPKRLKGYNHYRPNAIKK